jgi:phosphopantothenoylcysteine decarboxylase
MKILLGVTGSVAAKLTPRLCQALMTHRRKVKIVATEPSFYFWNRADVAVPVFKDTDEWPGIGYSDDDPVLHIELREWADVLLIAPLSANTMAKIANGLADNLLSCVARAWDPKKPIVLAPAMNTKMWEHPITQTHLEQIGKFYRTTIIQPVAKKLACGETGIGAMARVETIVAAVNSLN